MDLKELLNERQYEAVCTEAQYVRIVAGAGSGKTRVLTFRLAFLIQQKNVNPRSILAIAFTNKVAKEMKERALKLAPEASSALSISTFHSFCARFLRQECDNIGYPTNFTIYDDEDKEKLIKSIAEDFGYKKKDEIVKEAINYISHQKCIGNYPHDVKLNFYATDNEKECLRFFNEYELRKDAMYGLDFDDLLLRTIRILEAFSHVREKWQKRICHILIDEFQDTNNVQYHLVKLLMRYDTCLYVVGDPDQTIYTWRGANQKIILDFEKDFFPTETIILDRNYRSTQVILDTANTLISHNKMRIPKDLYTKNLGGDKILTNQAFNKETEAMWLSKQLSNLKSSDPDFSYRQVAVLYRSSYLTLPFEKDLASNQIPYRVFGGVRFYQRKEIKDVLAYVRLLFNALDDISFERIYNVPKRGIGDSSFEQLKAEKTKEHQSYFNYIKNIDNYETQLSSRVVVALTSLVHRLEEYRKKFDENYELYSKVVEDMMVEFGYIDYLASLDDGDDRIENVKALYTDIYDYIKKNPESTFEQYLQNVTLATSQDEMDDGEYVSLMTIHVAKGLEFDYVFVIGMNEGVFPSARTLDESGYIGEEEERRLCYVAFTRAKKKLFLSCNKEYSFMIDSKMQPSRFFKESNLSFLKEPSYTRSPLAGNDGYYSDEPVKMFFRDETPVETKSFASTNDVDEWCVGDIAEHKAFGTGFVEQILDDGELVVINFDSCGKKTLLAHHKSLSKKSGGNA